METVNFLINGKPNTAPIGTVAAAAILASGAHFFRTSATGEPRSALCGMGICFECRVTIDGVAHEKSCQILVIEGMEIKTDENV